VNFSERPPSKQWAVLQYRQEKIAEVWFKPEEMPFALTFRIPITSFQNPNIAQRLTTENLLKAVGITAQEVESCRHDGATNSGESETGLDLGELLPAPPEEVAYLTLHVSLKSPQGTVAPKESTEPEIPAVAPNESTDPEIPEERWQYLEARWNTIRGLETSIDMLRSSMQTLQSEMETCLSQALPFQAKLHALSSDLAQWDKAKSRVRYGLPKIKEFLHRSTWATASAERKKVEELYENHVRPRIAIAQIDEAVIQFDGLLKDRQVLSSQGASVHQECKKCVDEVRAAMRTLQSNAAANAKRKGDKSGPRGKSY
jgi:hypothetical protein